MSREIVLVFDILDAEDLLEGVENIEPNGEAWIGDGWKVHVPMKVSP